MKDEGKKKTEEPRLVSIELKVDKLTEEVRELQRICARMDRHISFVERTYDVVRTPANWIMERIGFGGWPQLGPNETKPPKEIS